MRDLGELHPDSSKVGEGARAASACAFTQEAFVGCHDGHWGVACKTRSTFNTMMAIISTSLSLAC